MTQAIGQVHEDFYLPLVGTATVPWRYMSSADHMAFVLDAAGLIVAIWTHGVDFTITPPVNTLENTGVLMLETVAPATGAVLRLMRATPATQDYNAVPGAEAIETQMDKHTLVDQEIRSALTQTVRAEALFLPPLAPVANNILAWNAAANAIANLTPASFMASLGVALGSVASQVYPTLADAVNAADLAVGQIVATLGRRIEGDFGSALHRVKTVVETGTPDGYSKVATVNGLVLQLVQSDSLFVCDQYGALDGVESFGAITACNQAALAANNSGAREVELVLLSNVLLANAITLGGPTADGLNIDFHNASIEVIPGGNISVTNYAVKVTAIRCDIRACEIKGNKRGSLWRFYNCARGKVYGAVATEFASHADARGILCDGDNMGDFYLYDHGGNEWTKSEPLVWDAGGDIYWLGTTLEVNAQDCVVQGGSPGWAKRNILIGAVSSNLRLNNVHPFNGNPSAGMPGQVARHNPINIENYSAGPVFLNDAYNDNGYIIDHTARLIILGERRIINTTRTDLVAPAIKIVAQETSVDDKTMMRSARGSVGFYMDDLVTPAPEYAWATANPLEFSGPGCLIDVYRQLNTYMTGNGDVPGMTFFKQGNTPFCFRYVSNNGLTPADDINYVRIGGGKFTVDAAILSLGKQGMGFGPGAGAAVVQDGTRASGVTINAPTGRITMVSAAGSDTWSSFVVTNAALGLADTVTLTVKLLVGGNAYEMFPQKSVGAGEFTIYFRTTGGVAVDQPLIDFTITRGANT